MRLSCLYDVVALRAPVLVRRSVEPAIASILFLHLTCQVRLSCLYDVVACVVVLLRAVCAYWSRAVAVRACVALQHVLCFVLCVGFGGRCLGSVRCAQVLHCCSSFAVVLWLPVSRGIVCVCVDFVW